MATIKTRLGNFKYKQLSVYLGIKQIDKEIAARNLAEVKEILAKHNVTWGLQFGSLLGAVREHDFISWDEDIDLYILREQEEDFKAALFDFREHGFELLRYLKRGLYSVTKNGEYIDFYVMTPFAEGLRFSGGGDIFFEEDLTDLIEYEFKGNTYPIARNYDRCLRCLYGDNYMTPVQYADFELPWYKIAKMKFLFWLKDQLPTKLHRKLVLRHHKKDFEKRLARMEKQGFIKTAKIDYIKEY